MTDHEYKQDMDIALMGQTIQLMDKKLDRVVECIDGNGSPGIKTQMGVQQSRLRIAYLWMAGLTSWFFAGKL